MSEPQVLICGAGPAGMVLALWLQRFQVPFRIIDKASGPGLASRAMVIQARVLEHYRQLGVADRILAMGSKFGAVYVSQNGHMKGKLNVSDAGRGLSKYPFSWVLPQHEHEEILTQILAERGVQIERNVELIDMTQSQEHVQVTMKNTKTEAVEIITVAYIAGCDGAHSFVRKIAGIKMEGGTYGKRFYVADLHIDPSTPMRVPPESANMNVCPDAYCMLIPFKDRGHCRAVGFVPEQFLQKKEVTFEDIAPTLNKVTRLKFNGAAWFSTYNLHHRVASQFRADRVFLSGDACHLHSPAGGQGMNAGICDASNLGWKLAAAVKQPVAESILDTYEPERRAFAQVLVNTTDTIFSFMSGTTLVGWLFRSIIITYILPFLTRFMTVRKNMFLSVSQLKVAYPQSFLSRSTIPTEKGKVAAGNRLPWVEGDEKLADNHESLTACCWQIHVYGDMSSHRISALREQGLLPTIYPWSKQTEEAGLIRDTIYLIRPDGYIGWMGIQSDASGLQQYLEDYGILRS